MATVTDHPSGSFCLHVAASAEPARAQAFWGALLGWAFAPLALGPLPTWEAQLDGETVAVLTQAAPGAPSHWLSYLRTDSPGPVLARVGALGGRLLGPWAPAGGLGSAVSALDGQGALLAFWQPRTYIGARRVAGPGAAVWRELATHDPAGAAAFYDGLVGWRADTLPTPEAPRAVLLRRGLPVAGLRLLDPDEAQIPAHWAVHLGVSALEPALAQVQGLGGRVVRAPQPVPGRGRAALIVDPVGLPAWLAEAG